MLLQYMTRKLLYSILVLWGVVSVIFFLFNVLPVNSARLTLGQRADTATVEAIEKELGLNLPMPLRYLKYLNELMPLAVHEDSPEAKEKFEYTKLFAVGESALVLKAPYLGRSYQNRKAVTDILIEKIPPTFILAVSAILIAVIIGIALGIVAALNHNKRVDDLAVTLSVVGISQPSYFIATILAVFLGYVWHDYTGLNVRGPLFDYSDYGDEVIVWKNLILPAFALGIRPIGIVTQLTRSSMIEVMSQDYIRTARAKGLGKWVVILKHALRNALNPVVTAASGWFAGLLAGSVFVESIFDFKGLGAEMVKALLNFDFPVAMGAILFIAVSFLVINVIVDLLYALLDPRISVK